MLGNFIHLIGLICSYHDIMLGWKYLNSQSDDWKIQENRLHLDSCMRHPQNFILIQGSYGSRIHKLLIFWKHHWLGISSNTVMKNYQIKLLVLKTWKNQRDYEPCYKKTLMVKFQTEAIIIKRNIHLQVFNIVSLYLVIF